MLRNNIWCITVVGTLEFYICYHCVCGCNCLSLLCSSEMIPSNGLAVYVANDLYICSFKKKKKKAFMAGKSGGLDAIDVLFWETFC